MLRAAIVASGSELVRGDRHDRNGPFLASALFGLGVDPAEIRVVGDNPEDLLAALAEGLEHDLLVVSGGLGPTHDDRTVELLARATGRSLRVDAEVEAQIEARSRTYAERMGRPYTDFAAGVRKQATMPEGAISAGLAGTAPALVLALEGCVAVTLPGPPRELQALWPAVLATPPLVELLRHARAVERRRLRFFGTGESTVAQALAQAGGDGDGVEVTICAHDAEIHVDLLVDRGSEARANSLEAALLEPLRPYLYSTTEDRIEEMVLARCRERGLTLGTAESCTGGLVAARLTSVPGSSEVFLGSIVAYANEVKEASLGVPAEVIAEHGAVSAEAAEAMARGARAALGVDVAVSVTGIAGPGGGTDEKPVGLLHLCVAGPDGRTLSERFVMPGDREAIRLRTAVAALHLVRRFVTET